MVYSIIVSDDATLEELRGKGAHLSGKLQRVEPMTKWLDKAISICEIAHTDDFSVKKSLLREIFGLNLFLTNKNVATSGDQFQISPLKNPWFALRATKEKTARSGDNFLISSNLEGPPGLEPGTPSLRGSCSNQLSYRPVTSLDYTPDWV